MYTYNYSLYIIPYILFAKPSAKPFSKPFAKPFASTSRGRHARTFSSHALEELRAPRSRDAFVKSAAEGCANVLIWRAVRICFTI